MFGQTFELHDLAIIGLLVVLEGVLSIDNALVLGLLARRLPHDLQKKALTYGLVGAFVFRFIAILAAAYLLHWRIVKLLGGAYLIYVAGKHFFSDEKDHEHNGSDPNSPISTSSFSSKFWQTVFVIEMTDVAFAVDSIVAAIGVVSGQAHGSGRHPKLWVIMIGGFLGVVLMRYAAVIFIKLLERFPRFETAAYLLVMVIGGKLMCDWGFNKPPDNWPIDTPYQGPLEFHDPGNAAFWVFWILMLACFCVGFIPHKARD